MKKIILLLAVIGFYFTNTSAQQAADDGILKVLAIGNSFSDDAVEHFLYDLAKADNKKIIIGNMYIGGAPVSLHVKNADSNKKAYSYRKINLDGEKNITKEVSLAEALKDEAWDFISLQQASPLSGKYDVIMKDLPKLISYVQSLAPNAKLIYHQTWAYQQDSKHKGFANYDKNQMTMYKSIMDATKRINKAKAFEFIVPAGTSIQNARTSSIGDHYTRDGFHLQLTYGRFTAACAWYEKLFNADVRQNPCRPEKVSELEAKIAKDAAHKAVKKPFKISKVKL